MEMKLPLGLDRFAKIREDHFYYIDKTRLIKELLAEPFEASLITRPRRFGKTLTMSMLADFFDISRDSRTHFAGLAIEKERELCSEWLNRWPILFLTLKSVEGLDFPTALERLRILIADLCKSFAFLEESPAADPDDRAAFRELKGGHGSMARLTNSLVLLTRMLCAHYGKPVILLLDEYDVPLAAAGENGYYREMLDVVRALLGDALKTNPNLKFAVVTGCLRIAKESIFTGTNHFVINSITEDSFGEAIGFTREDVEKLLKDTGLSEHAEDIRAWYDGYRFGRAEVYCPWDVLNYVRALRKDPLAKPENYWGNTSHNAVIRQFIERKDLRDSEYINADLETLIAGGSIKKTLQEDLTYDTLYSSSQNIWSLLLQTGYLTAAPPDRGAEEGTEKKTAEEREVRLRIPNEEVRFLFRTAVREWFRDKMQADVRSELFEAIWTKNAAACSKKLSEMVYDTISYFDYREDFYRAFMVGVLSYAGYRVRTNKEQGEGRPDIVLLDDRNGRAAVIELKWTKDARDMDEKCGEALEQIRSRRYAEALMGEYSEVICCGICFFKKRCRVKFEL